MVDAQSEPEPQRPVFEIDDLATLEVLIDPMRMRILTTVMKSGLTVREVAHELEVPVTRLYYHVNMLEEAGIIEAVETQKVGAMIRRRFRATAERYVQSASLVDSITSDRTTAQLVTALLLEAARVDAEAMLANLRRDPDNSDAKGAMGRMFLSIAPDRLEYWANRLDEVFAEIEEEGTEEPTDGTEVYSFTFVLAPLASPVRGATS